MMGVAHDRGNSVVSRVDTVVRLSLPLAVAVDTVVATKTIPSVSVVGISLGLSLSLPLAVAVDATAVSETVATVATVVATKTVASIAIVGIGISLRLGGGEGRKGKCQDSLHLSSATFCDKPSPC